MVVFMNTTGFELCARAPDVSPVSLSLSSPSRSLSHGSRQHEGLATSADGRSCTTGSTSCTLQPDVSGKHAHACSGFNAAPWARAGVARRPASFFRPCGRPPMAEAGVLGAEAIEMGGCA